MVAAGTGATLIAARRGDPPAIPAAFAYFTAMEVLQGVGWRVADACGTPANDLVTHLSALHIAFQPAVVNAVAMELAPARLSPRARAAVFALCAAATLVMLLQLHPFDWAGTCRLGDPLCGARLCLVTGAWHIAWEVPYNGLMVGIEEALGTAFGVPTYMLACFGLPLLYGAWRFALLQGVAGPALAFLLTSDPNEMPAVWCLFSIALLALGLSPAFRRRIAAPGGWGRPALS